MTDPSTTSPARPPNRRRTLLIVDDEDGPRESLRAIFKDDYELLMASDGPSAVDLVQKHRIDVAVLDIRMTGMSGVDVLERIKYIDGSIEAVMMTAFETTETIRKALRLRACDYLNKPFEVADMRAAVANAMQRRSFDTEIFTNTEKLQALLKELQDQKLDGQMARTRGDIYASIIHDINGPLTVISGFLQLLNQRIGKSVTLGEEDVDFVKDRLRTMTRQVTNCIEISRRYLGFLRKQPVSAARVSVNQLLVDLGQLLRMHPSLQNHEFEIQPLVADLGVELNGNDLIQLLLNLVVNAFQASDQPHRVEVVGEMLRESIDLTVIKDGPGTRLLNVDNFQNTPPLVRLSVSDNGPGIPLEVLPKIFHAYFTTKDVRQGTGLGLNIVQRLVQEGGGALQVITKPGDGTTFNVFLPGAVLAA